MAVNKGQDAPGANSLVHEAGTAIACRCVDIHGGSLNCYEACRNLISWKRVSLEPKEVSASLMQQQQSPQGRHGRKARYWPGIRKLQTVLKVIGEDRPDILLDKGNNATIG